MALSLRQLECFVASAEAGTLAGAAARVHLSPSAVALSVDELERTLGVQLFLRQQAKGLTITAAGRAVLTDARQLLGHAEELLTNAQSLGQEISGSLRIGCYTTIAPFLMPGILEGFAAEYAGVELSFVEGSQIDLQERLLDGSCEVALLYDLDVMPGITHATVYHTRPHVLLSARHRLAGSHSVSLRELAQEPMIMLDYPPSRHYFTSLLESQGVRPVVRHTTASFETVRSLVARGLGYSLLIQQPANDTSYEGLPIVYLEIEEELPEMPVLIAWPDRAKLTRRATAFVEFCRRELANGPLPATGAPRD